MSEKSSPRPLSLVLLFDPRDESYSICSHNLSAEDARRKLGEMGEEGFIAVTIDQLSHHPLDDPDDCTECRVELARVLAENQ